MRSLVSNASSNASTRTKGLAVFEGMVAPENVGRSGNLTTRSLESRHDFPTDRIFCPATDLWIGGTEGRAVDLPVPSGLSLPAKPCGLRFAESLRKSGGQYEFAKGSLRRGVADAVRRECAHCKRGPKVGHADDR